MAQFQFTLTFLNTLGLYYENYGEQNWQSRSCLKIYEMNWHSCTIQNLVSHDLLKYWVESLLVLSYWMRQELSQTPIDLPVTFAGCKFVQYCYKVSIHAGKTSSFLSAPLHKMHLVLKKILNIYVLSLNRLLLYFFSVEPKQTTTYKGWEGVNNF